MKLTDVFEYLQYGELAEMSVGGRDELGIKGTRSKEVVSMINLALTELHKRFPLRFEEVIVQQYDHIQTYHLHSRYSITKGDPQYAPHYIVDSLIDPFKDNVLKIERIHNEDGEELFLNDGNQYWSVHTPRYNTIQVPYTEKENAMSVMFRANHPKIDLDLEDLSLVELDIPDGLLEPLCLYVGARFFANSPSLRGQGETIDGQMFTARFEQACLKYSEMGLQNTENTTNLKAPMNGWI